MKIRLTKIGSVADPYVKNSKYGDSQPHFEGIPVNGLPNEGESFALLATDGNKNIRTSVVMKIVDDNTFETMNSVYRIELVK